MESEGFDGAELAAHAFADPEGEPPCELAGPAPLPWAPPGVVQVVAGGGSCAGRAKETTAPRARIAAQTRREVWIPERKLEATLGGSEVPDNVPRKTANAT